MAPGDSPTLGKPADRAPVVVTTLQQLLTPGVLSPKDDTALLMLLIRLQAAVANFNDKARTYNGAVASDRHRQVLSPNAPRPRIDLLGL